MGRGYAGAVMGYQLVTRVQGWAQGMLVAGILVLCVPIASAATNAMSRLVLTNVTEQTWPVIVRQLTECRAQRSAAEEAPYDPQKRGRMDPELLGEYHRHHNERIRQEMVAVEKSLLRRFDTDHDGELSLKELAEPVQAYRGLEKETVNSVRWCMKRYLIKVWLVDVDGDGVVTEGENDVAERIELMAQDRTPVPAGAARYLDIHELRDERAALTDGMLKGSER